MWSDIIGKVGKFSEYIFLFVGAIGVGSQYD